MQTGLIGSKRGCDPDLRPVLLRRICAYQGNFSVNAEISVI